jgi:hypothetical protein
LIVSDNAAANRLFEILGSDRIHHRLAQLGYPNARIRSRFSFCSEEVNRKTSDLSFDFGPTRPAHLERGTQANSLPIFPFGDAHRGNGFIDGEKLVPGPYDFSASNFVPLEDLHHMMIALVMPEAVPASARFQILDADRLFLLETMRTLPRQSVDPKFTDAEYVDNYGKFLIYGDQADAVIPEHIRITNKIGQAYGFLNDIAYVQDLEVGVAFFLSASVYVNADGIFNDDKYEYDEIGFPFLGALGRLILQSERDRIGAHRGQK